jgi:N4-gp56 family major capsid protein
MAITAFGTNDAQCVKIWSKTTMREALKKTFIKQFMGTGKKSVIQKLTNLESNAGDTVKFDLLMQASGAGVTGDNRLKDFEEELVYEQDQVVIDQLRNGHSFRRMSQQRTIHDMRTDAKDSLSDWFAGKMDDYMFRYLCGDTTINHGQAGLAPDASHYVVCGDVANTGVIATDEGNLSDNDQIDLFDLDYAKESAKTLTPPILPVTYGGSEYYFAVLHPYSVTDIRTNVNTGQWLDIQKNAGPRDDKGNAIFKGSLGTYNNIVLFESNRIYSPRANVRRNLFLGAQAGVIAFGNAYDKIDQRKYGKDNMFSWYEEKTDYGNEKGVAVGSIFGIKKVRFNSMDYGTIVMTCYSAAHG